MVRGVCAGEVTVFEDANKSACARLPGTVRLTVEGDDKSFYLYFWNSQNLKKKTNFYDRALELYKKVNKLFIELYKHFARSTRLDPTVGIHHSIITLYTQA